MIKNLPYKTNQFLLALVKLSIVLGAFYFIYDKLAYNSTLEFHAFLNKLSENAVFSFKTVLFLFLLTLFNWFFEILKWKILVSTVTTISFKESMEQSLGALTASLLTPNRIGEYGAKALYYTPSSRKKIMLLNLVGNMLQMATTILFGVIGIVLLSKTQVLPINYSNIFIGLLFVVVCFGALYFSLEKSRFEVKGFSMKKIIRFIYYIPSDVKVKTSVLSVLRYLVFSFQFYVLLMVFGVSIDYFNAMVFIGSMYLLASVVPSIFIFDVVIKGSVAVYLFSL
ncbi:MAG TPA: hypothetical protein VKZ98_02600, partial [Aquaticitalea sp.]|nr:hypothetical protein [Aquaticitalea sp.]